MFIYIEQKGSTMRLCQRCKTRIQYVIDMCSRSIDLFNFRSISEEIRSNNVSIPFVLHLRMGFNICVLFTSLSWTQTYTYTHNTITMRKSMALTTTNNMLNQIVMLRLFTRTHTLNCIYTLCVMELDKLCALIYSFQSIIHSFKSIEWMNVSHCFYISENRTNRLGILF